MTAHQAAPRHLGVVIDPAHADRFVLREVELPPLAPDEALIRVKAVSLNGGEVRNGMVATKSSRPGSDIAGVVERAAADGSGPPAGTRVVALSRNARGWSQYAHLATRNLAVLPDAVSDTMAAALPVAGLTAMLALEKGGQLLGKSVLITGASGGVGRYACQMAVHSGAHVSAAVRRPEAADALRRDGVHEVRVGEEAVAAGAPYAYILETQGGASLARSLTQLVPGGICTLCGNATNTDTTFGARSFYTQGRVNLIGLYLTPELDGRRPGELLARLVRMVQIGLLKPPVEAEASWREVADVARRYGRRELSGKVVMHVD